MSRRTTKARRASRRRNATAKLDLASPASNRIGVGYFDPWGRPCGLGTWSRWFESGGAERFLATDRLANGYRVSTIWLGLDHAFGRTARPLIFESGVFHPRGAKGLGPIIDGKRYATRREALDGHRALVAEWSKRPRLDVLDGKAAE